MNRNEIFEVVKTNMTEIIEGIEGEDIQETHTMSDFGADSLEIIEVVSRSMKQLGLKVPRTELSKAEDIRGLVDLFEQAQTAKNQA
jgi:acyl carrier protein